MIAAPIMRTFLLATNATIALLFTAFLAYTFLGRRQIDSLAREFAVARTERMVTPTVDLAEKALASETSRRLIPKKQLAVLDAEIAEFRAHPLIYIQKLVAAAPPKPDSFLAKMSDKASNWKERAREHYQKVLRRLLTDLRIFASTNVVAASLAFLCAWRSRERTMRSLIAISWMLLIATGFGIYLYIDSFSFFTILSDSYMEWAYPAILAAFFLYTYFESLPARLAEPN